ncbi:protein FAM131A [Salmo trutta]|uniref:protein FAM131A n=1 Tax=Salmo trutta TaxID=8032 RepID=UPI001130DDBB|nr:protein FAM131A-like [Salmo trutta]
MLRVDWSEANSVSDLALLGNTRTCLARRHIRHAPLETLDHYEVNVDDTVEMLPKSRRALTIQEIAALARSSLHGISQAMKDRVTRPTGMAQGRVAHLIEWKGWCKPTDTPAALESDFNNYSDLTEGEQEARFAAGVAEQFAIAEAKLRAWSSVDGDDSNDDSYDEDFIPANEPTTQSTEVPPYLRDILHSQVCQHLGLRGPCCEGAGGGEGGDRPSPTSTDTLCSSLYSLDEQHPLLRDLTHHCGNNHGNTAELAAKILSALQGGEELLLARLQRVGQGVRGGGDFNNLGGGRSRPGGEESPCYSVTYSETYLSPGEDEGTPCKDYEGTVGQGEGEREVYPPDYATHRKVSDVASSGVVSLDEDEEEEKEEEDREREQRNQ